MTHMPGEDMQVTCSQQIAKMRKPSLHPKAMSKDSNTKKSHKRELHDDHARTVPCIFSVSLVFVVEHVKSTSTLQKNGYENGYENCTYPARTTST